MPRRVSLRTLLFALQLAVVALALFSLLFESNGSKAYRQAVVEEEGSQRSSSFSASAGAAALDPSSVLFWSNDYHIAVVRDLKHLLSPFKATFVDKSLSGHCHLTATCATDLKVLHRGNAMFVEDPVALSRQFFDAYKDDPLMRRVDAFLCFHPVAMCQLFMPFNKTMIAISSTRYEQGRESPAQWRQLNEDMAKWATKKKNIVAGNSAYDSEYIKYFTGIDAALFPSYCGYVDAEYTGSRKAVLLAASRWPAAKEQLSRSARQLNSSVLFQSIRELYPHYEFKDLAGHPAIVHVPYQVSVMSLFEQYRMGIPLFFPSIDFLAELHLRHGVISERTWSRVRGKGAPRRSAVPKSPLYHGTAAECDPNNDVDRNAVTTWLQLADFYQWPHIQYFDSWDDCVRRIQRADLHGISRSMMEYSEQVHRGLMAQWKAVLSDIVKDRPKPGHVFPSDYDAAMRAIYG